MCGNVQFLQLSLRLHEEFFAIPELSFFLSTDVNPVKKITLLSFSLWQQMHIFSCIMADQISVCLKLKPWKNYLETRLGKPDPAQEGFDGLTQYSSLEGGNYSSACGQTWLDSLSVDGFSCSITTKIHQMEQSGFNASNCCTECSVIGLTNEAEESKCNPHWKWICLAAEEFKSPS